MSRVALSPLSRVGISLKWVADGLISVASLGLILLNRRKSNVACN
jgi:hypothetical protein